MSTNASRPPLARFARSYGDLVRRSRIELQVTPAGSEQRFNVNLMGVLQSGRNMLVSAPANPDKSLIAVRQSQVMTCQWLSAAAIFQFQAAITNRSGAAVVPVFDPPGHTVAAGRVSVSNFRSD